MKYQIQVIFALLLFSCGDQTSSNSSTITKEDETTIREIQISTLKKAYYEQDSVLLGELYHDAFQLVDDNGDTYSKEYELTYVANYGPTHSDEDFEILSLSIVENGTAIVFGKGTYKGVIGNEAYVTTFKATNVFVKVNDNWKILSSHVSGVNEDRFPMTGN